MCADIWTHTLASFQRNSWILYKMYWRKKGGRKKWELCSFLATPSPCCAVWNKKSESKRSVGFLGLFWLTRPSFIICLSLMRICFQRKEQIMQKHSRGWEAGVSLCAEPLFWRSVTPTHPPLPRHPGGVVFKFRWRVLTSSGAEHLDDWGRYVTRHKRRTASNVLMGHLRRSAE